MIIIYLIVGSVLVAGLMELIKQKAYKDKATRTHMVLLGFVFSILVTVVMYYGFEFTGKPISMIFYTLIVYIVQKQVDMKTIRPLIKKKIEDKLKDL